MFFFRLLLLCWLSLHEIFFFADAWINRSGLLIPCIISPETSRDVVIPSLTSDRESKSHHGWWTIQHDVCLTLVLHKSSLWKKKETSFRFEHQNQVLTFLVFLKLSWYLLFFVESHHHHILRIHSCWGRQSWRWSWSSLWYLVSPEQSIPAWKLSVIHPLFLFLSWNCSDHLLLSWIDSFALFHWRQLLLLLLFFLEKERHNIVVSWLAKNVHKVRHLDVYFVCTPSFSCFLVNLSCFLFYYSFMQTDINVSPLTYTPKIPEWGNTWTETYSASYPGWAPSFFVQQNRR